MYRVSQKNACLSFGANISGSKKPIRKSKTSFENYMFLAVVSTNLHGLFVDRIIPQTIALYKSITQVRDRSLGFEKKKKSKRSTNLDILILLKFDGFIVSSF